MKPVTLVITVVNWHATWELRNLGEGKPCWSYERVQQRERSGITAQLALIFPNIFMEHREDFGDQVKYHRQVKTFRITDFKARRNGTINIRLHVSASIAPYVKGRWCECIPIPGKAPRIKRAFKEPVSVDSPEVVLTSPLVAVDLKRLSQAWQDRFAKSVLLCGPPGSGKEHFSFSLAYGSGRRPNAIQTLSLGECSPDQSLRRLFGWRTEDGSIEPGLVSQAEESAIFVDEAHYPVDKPGVRAALLRTLEAGTYYPVGSDRICKTGNILWIFASSLSLTGRNAIGDVPPDDFWTRMSHVIQVHHPLDPGELWRDAAWQEDWFQEHPDLGLQEDWEASGSLSPVELCQLETIKRLFCFFWISRLEEYFGQEIVGLPPLPPDIPGPDHSVADPTKQILLNRKLHRLLSPLENMGDEFATLLIQVTTPAPLDSISVRGVRSMVSQLLAHAIGAIEKSEEVVLENEISREFPRIFGQISKAASLNKKKKSEDSNLVPGVWRMVSQLLAHAIGAIEESEDSDVEDASTSGTPTPERS